MNDAVAYIRSLAERHGRNADWAEKAVTEAATLTASQALEQNVIEFIAADRDELLTLIDGHEVEINGETIALKTLDAEVEAYEPNWRIRLLGIISNPEIVLLLGLIGLYGLMYEGWNPGAIVPGVVGVICLLLAAYALQVLPVNYAGLALIFLGIALMIAEAYAPSFGALGIGGIAAFVFGSIMMFDSEHPGIRYIPHFCHWHCADLCASDHLDAGLPGETPSPRGRVGRRVHCRRYRDSDGRFLRRRHGLA